MSFFSDFATTFNVLSDATFNTLIVKGHKQSNAVAQEYKKLLSDPSFRNTVETKRILMASTKDARKIFGIEINASKPAEPSQTKKPRTRKQAQPQQTSN